MHAFGQSGVDLYVRDTYWGTAVPDKDAAPGKVYEHVYFKGQPRVMRDITLYLSLYSPVKVVAIAVDQDARLEAAAPFATARPVVFYGTSITQGGCASRAGMSYQAILGRRLNLDHQPRLLGQRQGRGGWRGRSRRSTPPPSSWISRRTTRRWSRWPRCTTPSSGSCASVIPTRRSSRSPRSTAAGEATGGRKNEEMRALIRKVVSRRIAAGDTDLQLVEGPDLLGPSRGDGLVDGTHPNDLGFHWMAEGLVERLRNVLVLP